MTAHEVLIAARAQTDAPNNWGIPEALLLVALEDDAFTAAKEALVHALPAEWQSDGDAINAIDSFCDDPSVTIADILALYDRAIAATTPVQP